MVFPGFGIHPGRKVTWSKVLQVLRTRGSTTHQFTYFIHYLFQDKLQYPKTIKIQQVNQKINTKQFLLLRIINQAFG